LSSWKIAASHPWWFLKYTFDLNIGHENRPKPVQETGSQKFAVKQEYRAWTLFETPPHFKRIKPLLAKVPFVLSPSACRGRGEDAGSFHGDWIQDFCVFAPSKPCQRGGPQEKEGADQQEDGGVVPPVRGPKKGMTKHGFNPTMDI
jgi:hypothetical protein